MGGAPDEHPIASAPPLTKAEVRRTPTRHPGAVAHTDPRLPCLRAGVFMSDPCAGARHWSVGANHRGIVLAAISLIAMVASAMAGSSLMSGWGGVAASVRPNIVLIQADDQSVNQLLPAIMPRTERLLARGGTTFSDYMTTTPQCCPSGASLITGEYGHNSGVLSNSLAYRSLHNKGNVLPVWLRRAGYRTIHVGKFLNGYENVVSPSKPAPGWSDWYTVFGETRYYGYDLYANGRVLHYGFRPADNVTAVLNRTAVRLVDKAAPSPQPFYLEFDARAPHTAGRDPYGPCDSAAIPQARDEKLRVSVPPPRPPSFNESRVGDKPPVLRRPPLSATHPDPTAHRR